METRRYKIVKGPASHWSILTDTGDVIFGNMDFRNPREALAELAAVRGGEVRMATVEHPDGTVDVEFLPKPPAELVLTLPPAAASAVDRVLRETGDSPGEMFRKALGLYMLALNARNHGKAIGAADSPEKLEIEFTGF